MGGIDVDVDHRTNIDNLYAAGECCDQYHGANRLGGNSMLGAIYGGRVAAEQIAQNRAFNGMSDEELLDGCEAESAWYGQSASMGLNNKLSEILANALGIVRTKNSLAVGMSGIEDLLLEDVNDMERARLLLGMAILKSAEFRKESRGAHYRDDFPKMDENQAKMTVCELSGDGIAVNFKEGQI